ncbi:MAG: sulfatase-like hydrolase/transferase, partial [Akkermansiaceae bacterium]
MTDLRFFILVLISLVCPCHGAKPPNIVFFFTDDQTTSTIGCYGNPVVKTPNIDGLAARGTRFEQAFVSHPICWASRATILTGITARGNREKGKGDRVAPEALEVLYSDLLREKKYRTGYFGKWHVMVSGKFNRNDHFDEIEVIGRNPFFKKQPDGSLRHETDLIVDRGIDFIKRQPKDKPFALNMWFNACHAEDGDRRPGIGHFTWPQSANGLYEDTYIGPPRLGNPGIFENLPKFLQTSITRERFFWRWNTDERYRINMRAYYRMVTGIDNAIGRFLKALDEAGLADNTIIVYSADNGYHMANRGLAGKWSHYEESIKVPL